MASYQKMANTSSITLNGTTPAAAALATKPQVSSTYRVLNTHTAVIFVNFGTSGSVTAAATDFPVPAGETVDIDVGAGVTHAAVVSSNASTALVYFTPVYVQARF